MEEEDGAVLMLMLVLCRVARCFPERRCQVELHWLSAQRPPTDQPTDRGGGASGIET